MNIGVFMPCYGTNSFLTRAVKVLDGIPEVQRVIVANSQWYDQGAMDIIDDNTEELVDSLGQSTKAELHEGYWTSEEASRNDGLMMLATMDWVFMLDPDEFILPSEWPLMLDQLKRLPNSPVVAAQFEDYWKWDPGNGRPDCHVIRPRRDHLPIFALKVNGHQNKFTDGRCVPRGTPLFRLPGVIIHHFGMCHPDNQMEWKARNYTDRGAGQDPEWVDKVWNVWNNNHELENLALGRAQRDGMKKAVPHVAPDELVKILRGGDDGQNT